MDLKTPGICAKLELSNFIDQAPKVIALNSTLGKAKKTAVRERVLALAKKQGISTNLPRVSVVNLAAILKVLESFQRAFRDRFSRFFEVRELGTLEATEVERLNTAFDLWYHFAFHPGYPPKKRHRKKRRICEQTLVNFYKALNVQLRKLETSTRRAYLSPHRALWEQRPTPWIVIDSSDPLERMTSYGDVAVAVQTALEPSTNDLLKHFVCDAYCPVIMVVPLIQGHSLSMKAWKIQTWSLLQQKLFKPAWWHYVLHDVPVDTWRQLELSVLHSPGLETPAAVVAGLSALHMYVMHMHDLARVPESLRSDSDYFREYTERVLRTMSLVVEETRAAVSSMRERTRGCTQADLVSRPALGEIVTLLPAIEENARMPKDLCGKRPLHPGVLSDWSERLHTALSAAEMALLHWAADELHGTAD